MATHAPHPAASIAATAAATAAVPGLSLQQEAFFRAFGYVKLPGFFPVDALRTLQEEVAAAMQEQFFQRPFDGSVRHWTTMTGASTPFFSGLLEHPRFLAIAEQLLGPGFIGATTDANRYVGDTGWHADTRSQLQRGIKMAFYLSRVRAGTGALRVIPGSHLLPLPNEPFAEAMAQTPFAEVPFQAMDSDPGDVILFDLRLWHASQGGGADRRMATAVYYNDPRTDEEAAYAFRQWVANVGVLDLLQPRDRFLFSRHWLDNAIRHPQRARWIQRFEEMGLLGIPGFAETAAAIGR